MPSRVIDVGLLGGSVEPRLHQSQGESGQWAALSHCWGKTVTTRLTLATLEDNMIAIPIATLSQNFRDAIAVTRILGIRYVWIDSLCIIQDSAEDWLQESAKMGDIYKDSLITIAGTNAEESTAGFLGKRTSETRCHLRLSNDEEISVHVRPRIEWYGFAEIVGPLTHRAWVLQERLLAAQILHFGGQQMMWQCQTRTLAEGFCDADSAPEEQVPGAIESMLRIKFHARIEGSVPTEDDFSAKDKHNDTNLSRSHIPETPSTIYPLRDNIYSQWYQVVALYANLKLTKQTDKLPAIAGIARQIQVHTADTYLAGLWERDMQRGLHWWYNPPGVMVRPSIPRAPSWSWASLDLTTEEALVPSSADFYLCATHTSKYIPYEHDLTLMSFSPELTEHGCLGNSLGSLTLRGLWNAAEFSKDLGVPLGRFSLSYPTPLALRGQEGVCAAARLDMRQEQIEGLEMGCLQVGKFEYVGSKYQREEFVSALLLRRVGQRTDGSDLYARLGIAVLFSHCDPVLGWERREIDII